MMTKTMMMNNNDDSSGLTPEESQQQPPHVVVHRILAYGDSLTAGTSSSFTEYPYAPHLEHKLNNNDYHDADATITTTSSSTAAKTGDSIRRKHQYVVEHCGLPGWTAAEMVRVGSTESQYGLTSLLRSNSSSGGSDPAAAATTAAPEVVSSPPSLVSCVVILAGTNDIGYAIDDHSRPLSSEQISVIVDKIVNDITTLHQIAWKEGVNRTICIGIPPSEYQSMIPHAKSLAQTINDRLEDFCIQSSNQIKQENESNNNHPNTIQPSCAMFVPFPFEYERNGENWVSDGLHFSSTGYKVLGEYLAEYVAKAISTSSL